MSFEKIPEKKPTTVKNFGILIRYDSHTGLQLFINIYIRFYVGTHNVYKEYRDVTVCGAVEQMCFLFPFILLFFFYFLLF
jgi:large subunit ribosomal protein L18Ae